LHFIFVLCTVSKAFVINRKESILMAKRCQISKARPNKANSVSFSNKKHGRHQIPNLQWKRFWVEEEKRFVRLRVSARVIKLATKVGLAAALKRHNTTLQEALLAK
jgi:large subunit ribosomal protein L28